MTNKEILESLEKGEEEYWNIYNQMVIDKIEQIKKDMTNKNNNDIIKTEVKKRLGRPLKNGVSLQEYVRLNIEKKTKERLYMKKRDKTLSVYLNNLMDLDI